MINDQKSTRTLRIGDIIEGRAEHSWSHAGRGVPYAEGDCDRRIETIGSDWVVARDDKGYPWFYYGDPEWLLKYLKE